MEILQRILAFIVNSLLQEIVVVVFGVLFALIIQNWWISWWYGKWRVTILDEDGQQILDRKVSGAKVKVILAEPAEKAVFLKGMVSPYAELHCDIIEDGPKLGLLLEDLKNRRFIIDLRKNPPSGRRKAGVRK